MSDKDIPVTVHMPSVSIDLSDFAMMVSDAVSHEDFPQLVKQVDFFYADFGVSQETLEVLLDSLGKDIKEIEKEDKDKVKRWDEAVETLKEILNGV